MIFDHLAMDVLCRYCGEQTAITIGWIKGNDSLACPTCNAVYTLNRDQVLDTIAHAEQAIANLGQFLRKH